MLTGLSLLPAFSDPDDPNNRRRRALFVDDTPAPVALTPAPAIAGAPVARVEESGPVLRPLFGVGAGDAPAAAPAAPPQIRPSFEAPALEPAEGSSALPGGVRRPRGPFDPAEVSALPLEPALDVMHGAIDQNSTPASVTPPQDLDRFDRAGLRTAMRPDPHEGAISAAGPERKTHGWGRLLDALKGAAYGVFSGQGAIPGALYGATGQGRHDAYLADVSREEGLLRRRYADEDAADAADLERERDRIGMGSARLQQRYLTAETEAAEALARQRDAKTDGPTLQPQFHVGEGTATIYDPNNKTLTYQRDPNAPPRAAGNPDTVWQRGADGWETQMERDLQTGAYRPSLDANNQPIRRAPTPDKPQRPTAADYGAALDAKTNEYMSSEPAQQELGTLRKQLLWNNLKSIDPHLEPEGYDAEVARLQQIVDAAALDDGPVMATNARGEVYHDTEGTRRRDNAKRTAAAQAQQRLSALTAARKDAEEKAPKMFEARVRGNLGPQVRREIGSSASAETAPVPTMADFEAGARARGLAPGTPEYQTARDRFVAKYGGGQ